jgi:ABC-type Zn2+ transport system substrate-binding protein/surface adhesin
MRLLVSYAATIAVILLSAQAACAGSLFPKVVVTIAPLKPYVDAILKGHGEATLLLRPGQNAHSFALTLPQAQLLEEADIVIIPDAGMSPFLARTLAKKKKVTVVALSDLEGAYPLPYADTNPWLKAAEESATKQKTKDKPASSTTKSDTNIDSTVKNAPATAVAIDPHLWLDPERMASIAVPLAHAIAVHAPEATTNLVANARTLAKHLRGEVIPELRLLLGNQARELSAVDRSIIPFITYHSAYQYFLLRFRLTHYGEIVTRGEETQGSKALATALNAASNQSIRCLIGEQNNRLMTTIAKSSGARIILLSPEQLPIRKDVDALDWIESDYDRLLYVTAKAFGECL